MTLTADERLELDRLVAEQADDLEWLSRVDVHYPLATAMLWTSTPPEGFTDQRGAVAAVMRAPTVGLILGGERSGKSLGLKHLTVANALGGDHPMVSSWLELNDLPRDAIPPGPAEVAAVALTSNDSVRYHREDIGRLCPRAGRHWTNRRGKGEASLELTVPGYDRKGMIWFKAVDQGPESHQGMSLRWAWVDEEAYTEVGRAVYRQLRARVADQDGRIGLSFVPMEGFGTWIHEDLVRDQQDQAVIVRLDTMQNPHLPRARFERHYQGMDEDEVARRRFGLFRSRSGSVYPTWNPGDLDRNSTGHVCSPFEVPAAWTRFRGGDFGLVHPTCVLWGALGDDDTLYVYREYYVAHGESYPWHLEQVRPLEEGEAIEAGWADPSAKEGRDVFTAGGVAFGAANNDLTAGYDRVRERLRLQGDGRPRLKVFSTCTNLIREMAGLVWDPNRVDRVHLKKNDHAPDSLRYLCVGVHEWSGL